MVYHVARHDGCAGNDLARRHPFLHGPYEGRGLREERDFLYLFFTIILFVGLVFQEAVEAEDASFGERLRRFLRVEAEPVSDEREITGTGHSGIRSRLPRGLPQTVEGDVGPFAQARKDEPLCRDLSLDR